MVDIQPESLKLSSSEFVGSYLLGEEPTAVNAEATGGNAKAQNSVSLLLMPALSYSHPRRASKFILPFSLFFSSSTHPLWSEMT